MLRLGYRYGFDSHLSFFQHGILLLAHPDCCFEPNVVCRTKNQIAGICFGSQLIWGDDNSLHGESEVGIFVPATI